MGHVTWYNCARKRWEILGDIPHVHVATRRDITLQVTLQPIRLQFFVRRHMMHLLQPSWLALDDIFSSFLVLKSGQKCRF